MTTMRFRAATPSRSTRFTTPSMAGKQLRFGLDLPYTLSEPSPQPFAGEVATDLVERGHQAAESL
jgi:hypothetical protein